MLRVLFWLDFGVVLPLAVLGLWRTFAEWRRPAVLCGMLSAFIASVVLFFVFTRCRFPIRGCKLSTIL